MDRKILADMSKDYPVLKRASKPDYEASERKLKIVLVDLHARMKRNGLSLKSRRHVRIRIKS